MPDELLLAEYEIYKSDLKREKGFLQRAISDYLKENAEDFIKPDSDDFWVPCIFSVTMSNLIFMIKLISEKIL